MGNEAYHKNRNPHYSRRSFLPRVQLDGVLLRMCGCHQPKATDKFRDRCVRRQQPRADKHFTQTIVRCAFA